MYTPHVEYQAGQFTSGLKDMIQGIPEKVAIKAGKAAAASIGNRIKYHSEDSREQKLDPVEPITDIIKADARQAVGRPLVATGRMTDWGAFDVLYDGDTITLQLQGQFHHKWDNIIEIAHRSGKNWDYAFDVGEHELAAAMLAIIRWINETLGIDNFELGTGLQDAGQYFNG